MITARRWRGFFLSPFIPFIFFIAPTALLSLLSAPRASYSLAVLHVLRFSKTAPFFATIFKDKITKRSFFLIFFQKKQNLFFLKKYSIFAPDKYFYYEQFKNYKLWKLLKKAHLQPCAQL